MHASEFSGPMTGLPDPETAREFYEKVPTRRLVAWFVDVIITMIIGVPIATLFGLLTLGFGFVIFPFILMAVSFIYRVTTLTGGSATWGMRFVGIEFRKHDGSRFDFFTAAVHTGIYLFVFASLVLQLLSCLFMLNLRFGQSISDILMRSTAINTPE